MLNLRSIIRNYKETGSLAEHCSIYGFISNQAFITKTGAVGVVLQVQGIDYECLDQADVDNATKRLEAAFKLFGPEFRVYQYLFKSKFQPDAPRQYSNPVVNCAEQERYRYFAQKSDELFTIQIFYVILYRPDTTTVEMTTTRALGSFLSEGPRHGLANLRSAFSTKKQVLFIQDQIDHAQATLMRQAESFVSQLNELAPIKILDKHDAFRMLRRLLNFDPDKLHHDQLKYDVLTDKYLVGSPVECHPRHLTVDRYFTRVLTLREEPSESWPLILQQLLQIQATFHIATEWRTVETTDAIKYIEGMRTHFHKTKSSLTTSSSPNADRLKDETKTEFVSDLAECLKEVQKKGNYFGKFTLTIIVYGRDEAEVDKYVSDFYKVFSSKGGALYYETYNQLSAFFATQPGNSHFNFRQLYITNNNYADWSFLFTLSEGQRWNSYLNREALAIVETEHGTPFYLNLHQRLADGTGTDDVGHAFITGRTGSGKSFFDNFLALSFQKYEPRTFIFDIGGSYKKLTRQLRGSYLNIGAEAGAYSINPFTLPATTDNLEFLFSLVKVLAEGSADYQTTTEDDRHIYHAIESLYELDPDIRRLRTLTATLPKTLANRLHKWVEGGQYGHLFDNIEDTITFSHFQCFDFQGMDEYPQLIQALLFYVLHRASAVIYDPAIRATLKVFFLDEAWKFFTVPVIRNYLIKAAKTWRKHNGILILATQSPEDLKESNLLPLLDSLPTKIFLANPDADYDFYRDKFHLNHHEIELIQGLIPKKEALIHTATMAKKFALNVDRKSYWLYTNNPKDNEQFDAVVDQHGLEQGLELLGSRS